MAKEQEVTLSELRGNLSDLVNESAFGKNRIILNRRNKRLVAIIPIEDLEVLEGLERQTSIGNDDCTGANQVTLQKQKTSN